MKKTGYKPNSTPRTNGVRIRYDGEPWEKPPPPKYDAAGKLVKKDGTPSNTHGPVPGADKYKNGNPIYNENG